MTPVRPRPAVERDSAPFWAALARHELVAGRCADCGRWRWPLRAICGACGSLEWSVEPVSGRASVASFVVNRHGFGGAFPLPSTVVLARLAEQDDLLVPGGWAGEPDGTGLAIGAPLEAGFVDEPGDADDAAPFTLLVWRSA